MCWSPSISLFFSIIYVLFIKYYCFVKPKYWKQYILFSGFYLVMELFQTFQWVFGDVGICNNTNRLFTVVAYILIWLQPILFSVIGLMSKSNRLVFLKLLVINVIVFCYAMTTLTLGTVQKSQFYQIAHSIYSNDTCTTIGRTNHLVWQFKVSTIDHQPNHLLYLILSATSFIFYRSWRLKSIGLGWIASLIMTIQILDPDTLEMASTWCLFSVSANLVILSMMFVKIIQRKLKKINS